MKKNWMMDDKIPHYIAELPLVSISVLGETYQGKQIENLDLIVRININIPSEMFLNGDICRVIAILDNNLVVVKNLEDARIGVVDKTQILYPNWSSFPF